MFTIGWSVSSERFGVRQLAAAFLRRKLASGSVSSKLEMQKRRPAAAGRTPKLSLDTDQPTINITHTPPSFLQPLCQGLRASDQPPAASQVSDRFGMTGSIR